MPEEFGEHLIRDQRPFLQPESLQIRQIRSSKLFLLLFRELHPLLFCRVQVRGQGQPCNIHSVLSDPFLCLFPCLFWIVVLVEYPNTAYYKISNRVRHLLIFYLLVFDRIHDACIWTRCPGPPAEKQAHNIKDPAVYLTVDMGYFLSLCSPNPYWVFAAKNIFFSVSSDHRIQSHLKFQSCLITELAGVCFWIDVKHVVYVYIYISDVNRLKKWITLIVINHKFQILGFTCKCVEIKKCMTN